MIRHKALSRKITVFCITAALSALALGNENSRLQGQVEAALFLSPELNGQVLTVQAEDGAVTISGTVRVTTHQRLVEDIANSLPGVKSVTADLSLQGNRSGQIELSNAQKAAFEQWQLAHIAVELRESFDASPALDGENIEFSLDGDTLRLEGSVETEIERTVASQLAQRLDRVQVVDNQLTVTESTDTVEPNFN